MRSELPLYEPPTLEQSKELCKIFGDEFEKPRPDADNLQIALLLIGCLIKRVDVLEEQLRSVRSTANSAAAHHVRYR